MRSPDSGQITWLALASACLFGCSLFGPAPQAVKSRPADFSATYEWREGSLPPPYYYQYTVSVEPNGLVTLTMIPDYPADGVPVWVETSTVDAAGLDALYSLMLDEGVFTNNWRAEEDPPVGGSFDWLTITAAGQQVEIPPFPIAAQAGAAERVKAAVAALAPAAAWEKLNAQRAQYVAGHE